MTTYRSVLLVFALGTICVTAGFSLGRRSLASPHRVSVTSLNGKSAAFRAVTLGGKLIVQVGATSNPARPLQPPVPVVRVLPRGDTLQAVTPATYSLDLARGAVLFFTTGTDSLRVVVGRNPYGAVHPVEARGRRLTVRLVADSVVIDSQ